MAEEKDNTNGELEQLIAQGPEELAKQILSLRGDVQEAKGVIADQAKELKATKALVKSEGVPVQHGKKSGVLSFKGKVIVLGKALTQEEAGADPKVIKHLHDKNSPLINWNEQ